MSTPSFGPRDLAVHTQFIVFASGSPSHNTSLLLYNSDLFSNSKTFSKSWCCECVESRPQHRELVRRGFVSCSGLGLMQYQYCKENLYLLFIARRTYVYARWVSEYRWRCYILKRGISVDRGQDTCVEQSKRITGLGGVTERNDERTGDWR